MKYFASALLATATYARGNSGGILQGAVNSSVGGQHGYGYNVGNTYEHGDSHGQHMGHQYGYDNNNSPLPGAAYQNENVNLHIFGYDAVLPDPDFDLAIAEAIRDAVITELGNANLARETYILDVLQRRRERLSDIHEDNLLKIEAPFDYQLDMLEEEVSDIEDAMSAAGDDADDAWADLQERMNKYLEDRQEALNREMDKVLRILNRAVDEGKDIADVLAAMRLDWLQGVYVAG